MKAFRLNEALNPDTAVTHIEKATPALPGLYAAMNQRFTSEAWGGYAYILVDKYILPPDRNS
ncbi:hypothetical protein DFAR_2860002 [Desulfarculales bacterium]